MADRSQPRVLADMMKRLKNAEAEPLRPLIDEYLLKRGGSKKRYKGHPIDMRDRPRPNGRLSPSAFFGCQRQAVLKFTGLKGKRRIDPDQELLFEDGNWRHHKWQFMFYDMEKVLGKDRFRVISIEQFVVIPKLYVAGSLDAEIEIKMPSGKWQQYIIDFKGINDRGFQWIGSTDAAKDDNIRQLQGYMKARKAKRGILLYDNKNTNLPRTFTVDFSSEHWPETLKWIEEVLNFVDRKKMPPKHPQCRPGRMMYDGCPFKKICWSTKDTTDLQELAFDKSNWHGIDEAWDKGLEIYGKEFL